MKQSDPNGLATSDPGAKLDKGKLKAGIIFQFPRALRALAEIAHYGHVEKGYSRGGWQEVYDGPFRYFDAFTRHLLNFPINAVDLESRRKEIFHMFWNLAAVIELTERAIEKGEMSNDTAYLELCGTYWPIPSKSDGDRGFSDCGGFAEGEGVLRGAGKGTGSMAVDCRNPAPISILHNSDEDPLHIASRIIDSDEEEGDNKRLPSLEWPASAQELNRCYRGSETGNRTLPTKSDNSAWAGASTHSHE